MSVLDYLSLHLSRVRGKIGAPLERCTEHPNVTVLGTVGRRSRGELELPLQKRLRPRSNPVSIHEEPRNLYLLRDVWLSGRQGIPFFEPRKAFADCPTLTNKRDQKILRPIRSLARTIREPVFFMGGRHSSNRAHFLLEVLPYFMSCIPLLQEWGDFRIYLSSKGVGWQPQLLSALGISEDRLLVGRLGTEHFKQLLYIPRNNESRLQHPGHLTHFKERFESRLSPADSKPPHAIYLSRRDAPDRFVTNEDEVIELLKTFWPDLKAVTLSGMSPEEQADMFHRSCVVIGPHGQGFHNALFCKNSLILQLTYGTPESCPYSNWCDFFSALGVLGGNEAATLYSGTEQDSKEDWRYPIDLLKRQIEEALDARDPKERTTDPRLPEPAEVGKQLIHRTGPETRREQGLKG